MKVSETTGIAPNQEDIIGTNNLFDEFDLKTGTSPGMFNCGSDAVLRGEALSFFTTLFIRNYCLNHSHLVFPIPLPEYNYYCSLCESKQELDYIRKEQLYIWVEFGWQGGDSRVHAPRFFGSSGCSEKRNFDANAVCGLSITQLLPYAETEYINNISSETILAIRNVSGIGFFEALDIRYTDSLK